MFPAHLFKRTAQIGACGAVMFICAIPATGEASGHRTRQDDRVCASVYETAQQYEESGHLVEASQLFLKCASTTCGSAVSQECATRNRRLRFDLPSVVLVATDNMGEPIIDVRVQVDGRLLTSRLDGLSLPVDPGIHEFSFSTDIGVFASEKITLAKGERNRPISVSLSSQDPGADNSTSSKSSE
jgi:hypothetical protein